MALLASAPVRAQGDYPDRPVRWVVPYPTGGPLDSIGRKLAEAVGRRIGQPIVIENRGGAGGTIGTRLVASARPDGYTFLFTQADPLVNAVSLFKNLPYDPRRDFALVIQAVATGAVMMANPDVPGQSLQDVLGSAKSSGQLLC
jgi:tripartite-type tricarboxylate transporter receptor subunit TctC